MPKTRTLNRPTTATIDDCPVARLARDVAPLARAAEAADEDQHAKKQAAHANVKHLYDKPSEQEQLLADRLTAIQELALTLRATSPLGALFQAMLCLNLLDDPMGGALEYGDKRMAKHYVEQLRRAMESVIGVLETASGISREEVDNGYFVSWGSLHMAEAEKFVGQAQEQAAH